jgi:hypothetical protein
MDEAGAHAVQLVAEVPIDQHVLAQGAEGHARHVGISGKSWPACQRTPVSARSLKLI